MGGGPEARPREGSAADGQTYFPSDTTSVRREDAELGRISES